MLKDEFQYYKDNQDSLVAQYDGKHIVIKNKTVVGVYDSDLEAYLDAEKKFEKGTYIIMHCLPGKESYTQTFHSRVTFARYGC